MKNTPFTPKHTMKMVNEMEDLTGKPVSASKRCELQSLILQWSMEVWADDDLSEKHNEKWA